MNNLLVTTDFSICANAAIESAFKLAHFTGSRIHLMHVAKAVEKKYYPADSDLRKKVEEQIVHNAEVLMQEWKDRAAKQQLAITTTVRIGDFQEELETFTQRAEFDMLVMGSHGSSGKREFFIGSNTQKTVRSLHMPILIVKEAIAEFPFRHVVFASSFDDNEKPAFERFLRFVRPFQPVVHLVSINTSGFFSQPYVLVQDAMAAFRKMAAPMEVEIHFYKDYTVEAGIRHMSEAIEADLVGLSNHNRRPLKRLFSGSNVEALINHSKIPVMSIDFPGLS